MTPEEIESQIRDENPYFRIGVGDTVTTISPETDAETYDAMIAERIAWRTERQEQDALETEETTRANAAKARYQALKAGTATAAQTQQVVAYLLRQRHPDLAP